MAISYMLDLEQLSVLTLYAGLEGFLGLPTLPVLSEKRSDELLEKLSELGMVHLRGAEASVDLGLAFILSAMAKPELMLRSGETVCCCTKRLGVVVAPDKHTKSRYRITPIPSAAELAERMREAAESDEYSLWRDPLGWQDARLPGDKLEQLLTQIYTEAREDE